MQMAAPPLINPPLAEAGLSIELPMQSQNNSLGSHSSTPPRIRRPRLNAFPSPFPMSPRLPPVDALHTANTDGHSLPAPHISQSTLPATHISQSPPAAVIRSVPPTSSAPGRRSARTTRPSTRAEDANKIGDDARTITSKRKRKGVTAGSTAHAVAAKIELEITTSRDLEEKLKAKYILGWAYKVESTKRMGDEALSNPDRRSTQARLGNNARHTTKRGRVMVNREWGKERARRQDALKSRSGYKRRRHFPLVNKDQTSLVPYYVME
ncbi:hypothetical protein DEU56DRAFT_762323 [Suillus clintonianus]|uniref:uncharacterized protein n=1 Tax=Suillus clintonianus TaxID=1904413 RepID=UPI001B87621B|nr:uncharacterized protein DEU56DRAFT_762323 [Suillus clintonianus]KAG2110420.1 hypothetical protein DEU56DRAFT_762323 [Suillus clintonianus]